jgi:isopenicillin N synthase-like dioxygenase
LCSWLIKIPDFSRRKEEITKRLVDAAENAGFFTLVDHGITVEEIESQFAISKAFFDLPAETKRKTAHDTKTNNGWEYMVRISDIKWTGA